MKRINLNIPEELLKRLDTYCQKRFTNRTEVVKRALLELLEKEEEQHRDESIADCILR
jgi:metal-responsive CopG/Arc/MetJ family transcriptional regulator